MTFLPASFDIERVREKIYELGNSPLTTAAAATIEYYEYRIDGQPVSKEEFEIALGHATLTRPGPRNYCVVGVQQ